MSVAIALFTRDLRVHDNPVLHAACQSATEVVPLFVLDTAILCSRSMSPNRAAFLADLGAGEVHLAADVSGYSQRREQALRERLTNHSCRLRVHATTITVVEPGAITPSGGGAQFAVFTPYYRRWLQASRRNLCGVPRRITLPRVDGDPLPGADELCPGWRSPHLPPGGEAVGRRILSDWLAGPIDQYDQAHDDLAADGTSRLRQAQRYDPDGGYVRRYLPELRDVPGPAVHQPWKLDPSRRAELDYPDPIIDLSEGAERLRAARDESKGTQ